MRGQQDATFRDDNHTVEPAVAAALDRMTREDRAYAEQLRERAISLHPSRAVRELRAALYRDTLVASGMDPNKLDKLRDLEKGDLARILDPVRIEGFPRFPHIDFHPRAPTKAWFLHRGTTYWWPDDDEDPNQRKNEATFYDGVSFTVRLRSTDGELVANSFGETILFEIPPGYVPESPSSRWIADPRPNFFGDLEGYVFPGAPAAFGRCDMTSRLEIFQLRDDTSVLMLDSDTKYKTLIDISAPLRPDATFPAGALRANDPYVVFGNVDRHRSLWARLTHQFDIKVSNAWIGTFVHLLVQTPKWQVRVEP